MPTYLFLALGALLMILSACAGAPEPPEARQRALALINDDDPRGAIDYIDQLQSADLGLQIVRAQASLEIGQLDGARVGYRKVADEAHDQELVDFALRNLAALELQDGHAEAAYAALGRLSQAQQKDPAVQREFGVAAVAAGRLDLARQHFGKLPKTDRQQIEQVLGQDFLNQGR